MNIPFEIVHKKINMSNPLYDWQHELYARKRIGESFDVMHRRCSHSGGMMRVHLFFAVSATLSNKLHPTPMFAGGSLFDQRHSIKDEVLARNIKFVAETLSKHIYGDRSWAERAPHRRDGRESADDSDLSPSDVGTAPELPAAGSGSSRALDVVAESFQVNSHFVSAWLDFLSTQPRAAPFLDKKAPFMLELEKVCLHYKLVFM